MKQTFEQKPLPATPDEELEKPEIWWMETARMFYGNKAAVLGLIGLLIIILVGLLGPVFFRADPFDIVAAPLAEPGGAAYLGTDYLGRVVFLFVI